MIVKLTDDNVLMNMAFSVTMMSDDNYTQVGSVILLSDNETMFLSANNYPYKLSEAKVALANANRDFKLQYIEHAERNVIYAAAKAGYSTKDAVLYCTWACCQECARGIVAAGIKRVVTSEYMISITPERWRPSIKTAHEILREGGVELVLWKTDKTRKYNIFQFDGKPLDLNKA